MSDSSPLQKVRLGRSGLKVTRICHGTWQLSPRFWGEQPEDVVSQAMIRSFELGVNFFDNADAYGDGYAEQVMGKAMAELPRDQVVIATKLYHHFHEDGRRYGDLSREYVFQACENSLRRLKMDYIDLYQCHAWDPLTDPSETAEALDRLKEQGKIRAYGVSNWNVEQMRLGAVHGNFTTLQPPYSLLRRDIEEDLLPYCQANDIGTLVYSPLQTGLLSGKYTGTETFTDFRKDSPNFQGERFKTICDRVRQVGEIGAGYGLSVVQTVLAVTLMHPGITCAIVGVKTPEHIEEAVGAADKQVSREDWYRIRALLTV